MHKNTVTYKLNQIKKIIGRDIPDGMERDEYIASCHIIRYLEYVIGDTIDPATDIRPLFTDCKHVNNE